MDTKELASHRNIRCRQQLYIRGAGREERGMHPQEYLGHDIARDLKPFNASLVELTPVSGSDGHG